MDNGKLPSNMTHSKSKQHTNMNDNYTVCMYFQNCLSYECARVPKPAKPACKCIYSKIRHFSFGLAPYIYFLVFKTAQIIFSRKFIKFFGEKRSRKIKLTGPNIGRSLGYDLMNE